MISFTLVLAIFIPILIYYLFNKWKENRGLPPGPWGFPIVGYLPFIIFRNPVQIFRNLKKKYGKVFSLQIGEFKMVVINDYKILTQAFKEEVFSGRPNFELWYARGNGKKRGIVTGEGQIWAEQRRFALKNLREFGYGTKNMENLLLFEAKELINYFNTHEGKPIEVKGLFNASVLNSLWFICTGSRFEADDPNFNFLVTTLIDNMQKLESISLIYFFPWVLKQVRGWWAKFIYTRDKLQGLIRSTIKEHELSYDPEHKRDFIDSLIEQWKKSTESNATNSSFHGDEGEINIAMVLIDFFVAGVETTSSTLQWILLYMVLWPEIQKKVADEIDSVIGPNRTPSLDDRAKLIYTEATLQEISRYCALATFSIYHRALEDTSLEGFKIPKDTIICGNINDAHFDKDYWGDPQNFRPERWIDPTGTKILKHPAFMPYSTGKRICLGESLAKDTLFIFFTSMMQNFTFTSVQKREDLSLEPHAFTLVVAPKAFQVIAKSRNT